jgi:hypothetical protein
MSFWSFTLMMTRLGPSAQRGGASESNATNTNEKRNNTRVLSSKDPVVTQEL